MRKHLPLISLAVLVALNFWLITEERVLAVADCTPTGHNRGEHFIGCPSLKKLGDWFITWPDQHFAEIEVVGRGAL